MDIKELFEEYKGKELEKRLVFCHFQTQEGFEFKSTQEFAEFLDIHTKPIYIMNKFSNKDTDLYDFFEMEKVEPYLVLIKHPVMTNAYYKAAPDATIDSYVSKDSNIYRYLFIKYDNKIQEHVIELPQTMDKNVYTFLREHLGKNFFKNNYSNTSLSMVFTNSNRYKLFDEKNFIIIPYNEIYTDWDVKHITSANLSKKIWKDIMKLGNE